jgi:hypothetical protein
MNENTCRTLESFIVLLPNSYNNEPTEADNNERRTHAIDLDRSFCNIGQTGSYIIVHFRKQKTIISIPIKPQHFSQDKEPKAIEVTIRSSLHFNDFDLILSRYIEATLQQDTPVTYFYLLSFDTTSSLNVTLRRNIYKKH